MQVMKYNSPCKINLRMSLFFQKVILSCFLAVCTAFIIPTDTIAQTTKSSTTTKKKTGKKKRTRVRRVADTDEQRQLMADKVTIKRELQVVDSIKLMEELEEESLIYPADELYGIWNTKTVNPYAREASIEIPDSFQVDLSSFVMPIEGKVTSRYGPRRRRMHYGTDVKLSVGDTIRAAFSGKVRVKYFQRYGYGYYMVLRHSNGLETVYGHLSKFLVDSNDIVEAGQPIALGGNTGRSTGPHLHFEMRFLGIPINPEEMVDFENFVAHTDTYTFTKNKVKTIKSNYAKKNGKAGSAREGTYYRIKKGDSLSKIAQRTGTTVERLCKLNSITTKTTLRVGRMIRCS